MSTFMSMRGNAGDRRAQRIGKDVPLETPGETFPASKRHDALFGHSLKMPTQHEVARQVAFVPQDTQPTFPFSVAETVLMGRFPHRRRVRWD